MATIQAAVALLFLSSMIVSLNSQQPYVANLQLNCSNHANDSITQGFRCGFESSCQSYVTFRAEYPYNSPASIGYLLGVSSSASSIASINNISSDVSLISPQTLVTIPVHCSCFNNTFYQHNASYIVKNLGETYFSIANDTYQGLTTCHSLIAQNSIDILKIVARSNVTIPLRCACPSRNQSSSLGIKYLLTYLVTSGDTVDSIASRFSVTINDILDANELPTTGFIYPFTPLLVPLTTEPKMAQSSAPPQPPPPPPNPPPHHHRKWVYVGIGIGAFVFLTAIFFIFFFCRSKPRKADSPLPIPPKKIDMDTSFQSYGSIPVSSGAWSLPSEVMKSATDSLTVYPLDELMEATGNFSEDRKINGTSVYRGTFKGNDAAVKVVKGDVSEEITILSKINHSNIIRLSGFCTNEGNNYLIYEFAHNGSLYDRLHQSELTWNQRVQIACDIADGLNYLHNYTSPTHVHKNLTSRNILLDGDMRAKVTNLGRARKLEDDSGMQMTAHVMGAHGYLPAEYVENGVVTAKMDVYAFGVILAEIISGREAAGDELLSEVLRRVKEGDEESATSIVDVALANSYPLDMAMSMVGVAKKCVAIDVNERPNVSQVFVILSKVLSSSMDWNPSSGVVM